MSRSNKPGTDKTQAGARRVMIMTLAAVAAFAIIGSLLVSVRASSFVAFQEAEAGAVSGRAAACDKPDASGAKAVSFGVTTDCQVIVRNYTNPVKVSTADPGVLRWENRYYMVSTAGIPAFGIFVSDDLVNWTFTGKSVFNGTHPWGKDRFWAPELHRVGDRFAVYYSASQASGVLAVGVATADSIEGPYTDLGQPLVRDSYSVIDVNFFRDDDGRQYLYWKEDEGNTRIFGQEINQAGTGFIGSRQTTLQKGLAWEGAKGIEASWVTKKDGMYYMFYSGELFSADAYAIGVARASSPLATYTKKGDPILRTGNRWKGPGHNSTVRIGTNDYMVYHAWDRTAGVGDRVGLVDKITWTNGWPAVGNGRPSETPQPYPN